MDFRKFLLPSLLMGIYYDVIYNLQTEQICLLLCITIGHLAWKLLILLIESPHFLLKWLRSTLQNSLSRFQQSILSDCNSFPRFTHLVLLDSNSFTRYKELYKIEEMNCKQKERVVQIEGNSKDRGYGLILLFIETAHVHIGLSCMNVQLLRPCLRFLEKRNKILLPISHHH